MWQAPVFCYNNALPLLLLPSMCLPDVGQLPGPDQTEQSKIIYLSQRGSLKTCSDQLIFLHMEMSLTAEVHNDKGFLGAN